MPDESPFSRGPVALMTPDLVGGTPLYVTGEELLQIHVINSATGVTVRLAGRFLQVGQSRILPFNQSIIPSTDRVSTSFSVPLGEGWLLDAAAIVSSGSPLLGQTWVRLGLVRGSGGAGMQVAHLGSGYVTTQRGVAYPLSLNESALEGPGALRSITGSTPAAGAHFSETVPTGARWEVICLRAQLTASGTVATRVVGLELDDGALVFFTLCAQATQTAGQVISYTASQGTTGIFSQADNRFAIELPINNRLGPGFRIRSVSANFQVGDQWTAPQLLVREWLTGE